MTVAVLALQGAFIEHEHVLEELGVKTGGRLRPAV